MTYNVFGGTLNLNQSINHLLSRPDVFHCLRMWLIWMGRKMQILVKPR